MSNPIVNRMLATDNSAGALALRVPIGIIFAAHGAQKLFGWFGGYGLEGTGQFFGSIGLNPGYLMALLAGAAEFFGGLALIFGLLVRPAAASLAFTRGRKSIAHASRTGRETPGQGNSTPSSMDPRPISVSR